MKYIFDNLRNKTINKLVKKRINNFFNNAKNNSFFPKIYKIQKNYVRIISYIKIKTKWMNKLSIAYTFKINILASALVFRNKFTMRQASAKTKSIFESKHLHLCSSFTFAKQAWTRTYLQKCKKETNRK